MDALEFLNAGQESQKGSAIDFLLSTGVSERTFGMKAIDFLTMGHLYGEYGPEKEVSFDAEGNMTRAEVPTGDPGFFADPVTALAMGGVAGVKAVGGLVGKGLAAGREALGWFTGGGSEVPALAKAGAKGIVRLIETPALAETAAKRAGKQFAEIPVKMSAEKFLTEPVSKVAAEAAPHIAPAEIVQPKGTPGGKRGAEGVIGRINEMGGLNIYDSYNPREMRQFSDVNRVMKKSGLSADEMAANLNDEGFRVGSGDDLIELLKTGDARKIFTPDKQDVMLNREARRLENEWLKNIEAEGFDTGRIQASRKEIVPALFEEIRAQGVDLPEEVIAKELGDFFNSKRIQNFKGEAETASLSGISPAETFSLVNPETEIGTLKSLGKGPQTRGMFADESGAIDPNLLTLGVPKFIQEDVIPTSKSLAKVMAQSGKDIRNAFSPASAGGAAQATAGIMRQNLAEMARSTDQAQFALQKARNYFTGKDPAFNMDFIDKIETGSKHPDVFLSNTATTMRDLLDKKAAEVQALGTGKLENLIEDYFPHMWSDPKKANEAFQNWYAKKPMEGSKAFLKQRTIPTTKEGLDMGLVPISDNPVELTILKLREMDKYIMAQKTLKSMKDDGLATFVKAGWKAPDGLVPINDRIATVYAPPDLQGKFPSGAPAGKTILGAYYAPEDAARIINNYLSPGLRGNQGFRAYLGAANVLNQAQLGLSAFHLGFTSVDAMVSKMALSLNQMAHLDLGKAAKSLAEVPFAPVTNILRGNKLYKEWMMPGTQDAGIGELVDAVVTSGGRAKMDKFYATEYAKKAADAFRSGNILGGLIRTPFAAVDLAAKPIMEYIVPRQKLGVFADLAKYELERLEKAGASEKEIQIALGKVWDSVDNRMGQLVYDNLFWNKMGKDLGMASVRSLGWNLGTIREIGGGGVDLLKAVGKVVQGKSPEMTYRMAYTASLPILTGMMGGTLNYLMTGEAPKELKDYYFPRTGKLDESGKPDRLSLPSYIKDLVHYYEQPVKTVTNKLHPALSMIGQMLENEDFYGVQIADWSEGVMATLSDPKTYKDYGEYLGKSVQPFGIRNLMRERQLGGGAIDQALPFIGLTPAPAAISKSKAENMMSEFLKGRIPNAAITKEQAEIHDTKRQILTSIRQGKALDPDVAEKLQNFSPRQLDNLINDTSKDYFESRFKSLTLKEALDVFGASTPEEKIHGKVILIDKISRLVSDDPRQVQKLLPKINKVFQDLIGEK